eukprot:6485256-Amphidinium_carterae.2
MHDQRKLLDHQIFYASHERVETAVVREAGTSMKKSLETEASEKPPNLVLGSQQLLELDPAEPLPAEGASSSERPAGAPEQLSAKEAKLLQKEEQQQQQLRTRQALGP